jgi:hypothetical protein
MEREQRLHVATYVHLKLLEYKHRNYLELITKHAIPNDCVAANQIATFDRLCHKLSQAQNRTIQPHTSFLGVNDLHAICHHYPSEIANLVSAATGFKYIKRDVAPDLKRARLVLYLYLVHVGFEKPQDATFGIMHIVAAFCSILHQRKTRTKLARPSKRYELRRSAPQKQLDSFINGRGKYLPFTTRYLYIERMVWYGTVFSGTKEKYDHHLQLIIAQTKFIQTVCKSNNHWLIFEHFCAYKSYMTTMATEFIHSHDRQDTSYEWIDFR